MSAATSPTELEIVKAPAIAKLYNTTAPTIYRWAKEGKIPCIAFEGIIRFNVAEVRAAIEGKEGK